MAADNKTLARFELVGIPPAPRGVPQIEVSFDIDANGIVHVSAKDLGTGKQQAVRVVSNSGLTEAEIQQMVRDAQTNAADDARKRELADARNNADGLIYTTEKSLEEYGHVLTPKDVAEITADLQNLKEVVKQDDPAKVKEALQRLEGSAYRIADAIYTDQAKTSA
jgi:molecular chaperone DnaK